MNPLPRVISAVTVGLLMLDLAHASGQVLGTFRWQFAPYCNVVTLLVEQKGGAYALTGTDDQCGGSQRAAAWGTAHVNPDGTVSVAVTVLRSDGIPSVANVIMSVATLSGPWKDQHSDSGSFVYNPPASPGGSPRPIKLVGNFAIAYTAAADGDQGSEGISFGLTLPAAPGADRGTNFIPAGSPPTANCPGSAADPQAAIGHLCVYERTRLNVQASCIARTGPSYECDLADETGASIWVTALAGGNVLSAGRWAVTVP